MNQGSISISSTATQIIFSNSFRKKITLQNLSSGTIYIGGNSSVTTTTGYPMDINDLVVTSDYTGEIYGIVASGTSTLSYVEEISTIFPTASRHYRLNEIAGTTLFDAGSNATNATKTSFVTINQTGKIAKCISIAAVVNNGYQNLPLTSGIAIASTDSVTVCGWIKFTSFAGYTGGWSVWLNNDQTNPSGLQLNMNIHNTGAVVAVIGKAGVGQNNVTHGTTLSTGTWYFFAYKFDGTNGSSKLYFNINNGTEVNTNYTMSPQSAIAAIDWRLVAPDTNAVYFEDFRIYNRILTANELTLIYNSGNGTYN